MITESCKKVHLLSCFICGGSNTEVTMYFVLFVHGSGENVHSDHLDLFYGVMDGDSWTRPPLVLRLTKGGVFGLKACMWLLSLKTASSEL